MAFSVSNTTGAWVPAQVVSVAHGAGGWNAAKSVSRTDGNGNWSIVWVPLNTVTIAGPDSSLSLMSGYAGSYIAPSVFDVTLSNPGSVAVVVLQESSDIGATWTTIKDWTAPTTEILSHPHILPAAGAWLLRAVATHYDGRVVYSTNHSITCYTKTLLPVTSDPNPIVFERFQLSAVDSLPAAAGNTWLYRLTGGDWVPYGLGNPQEAWQELSEPYEWTLRQNYADGSILYSSPLYITAQTLPHFHELVPVGGDIQLAMDRASRWHELYMPLPVNFDSESTMACVELVAAGVYEIVFDVLHYRRGVRLFGNGATIRGAAHQIFCGDNNGGGGYNSPNTDWKMEKVKLDCRSRAGGIATAHVKRFELKEVEILNIGGGKHHVNATASGGVPGPYYNVRIIGSKFWQDTLSRNVRTKDEAVHIDHSWDGAAPDVANDGTVTNNVVVSECEFYQVPRAVGGHTFHDTPTKPVGLHANIFIGDNTFTNVNPNTWGDGAPDPATSEGAVRSYYWKNVVIQDNTFRVCLEPVMVHAPVDSFGVAEPMGPTVIRNNIFEHNTVAGRHAAYGSSAGGNPIGPVAFYGNTLRGLWGGSPGGYFAGFSNTDGILLNETVGLVIRDNVFEPNNYDEVAEYDYNKYQDVDATNLTGGVIEGNTISDGTISNS